MATLLVRDDDDTWKQIRELFWHEIQSPAKEFSTARFGFIGDEETKHKMLEKLEEYARGWKSYDSHEGQVPKSFFL